MADNKATNIPSITLTVSWQTLLEKYLSLHLYEAAKFYAERMYYEDPSDENLAKIADVYFRMNKVKQCYIILHDIAYATTVQEVKYLFALSAVLLHKLDEAEAALHPGGRFKSIQEITLSNMQKVPGGAAGCYLLGLVSRRQHRTEFAKQYLSVALQMDPFAWMAIHELCELGTPEDISHLLQLPPHLQADKSNNIDIDEDANNLQSLDSSFHSPSKYNTRSAAAKKKGGDNANHPSNEIDTNENMMYDERSRLNALSAVEKLTTLNTTGTPGATVAIGLSTMTLQAPFSSPNSKKHTNKLLQQFQAQNNLNHSINQSQLNQSQGNINHSMINHSNNNLYTSTSYIDMQHSMNVSSMPSPITTSMLQPHSHAIQSLASTGPRHNHADLSVLEAPFTTQTTAKSNANTHNTPYALHCHNSRLQHHHTNNDHNSSMDITPILNNTGMDMGHLLQYTNATDASSSKHVNALDTHEDSDLLMPLHHSNHHNKRRVSFGPVARLSFSGHVSDVEAQTKPQHRAVNAASSNASAVNNKVSMAEDDHEQSTKWLRRDVLSTASHKPSSNGHNNDENTYISSNIHNTHNPVNNNNISNAHHNIKPTSSTSSSSSSTSSLSSVLEIFEIVRTYAIALQQLQQYQCLRAIDTLMQLPRSQYLSGRTCQLLGRAYAELHEYTPATLSYRRLRQVEPWAVTGLEVLSSVLWHLRREQELAALAQQLLELDRQASETWCVIGNLFSLQREPLLAIKYFQRALQLDPHFTYAYTLCGHECVSNEDLDKAVGFFRRALQSNPRHYNAWYGLGSIYYRQERFEVAEYHFRRAQAINRHSSVLDCYLSMSLSAQGSGEKVREALDILQAAIERGGNNAQLRFQKAHILMSLDEAEAALEELLMVVQYAPREPPVHGMLAQVYSKLSQPHQALLHANAAMDLDPKEASSMKAIIESFEEPQFPAITDCDD